MEKTINKMVKARDEIKREILKKEKEKEEIINKYIKEENVRFNLKMLDTEIRRSKIAYKNATEAIENLQ